MPRTDFKAPNGDSSWNDFSGLYSKGLKQTPTQPGVPDAASADAFVDEIMKGKNGVLRSTPALFEAPGVVLGNMSQSGKLNGPQGAFAGHVASKPSGSYTTVAPPKVGSPAFAAELAELYWASLLRDVAFRDFATLPPGTRAGRLIQAACDDLSQWAAKGYYLGPVDGAGKVTPAVLFRGGVPKGRLRDYPAAGGGVAEAHDLFAGETVGPYLSQLCLVPTMLGAQLVDQKIAVLAAGRDYMLNLGDWSAVQNGVPPAATAAMDPTLRHIRNGRDLASFTRVDELYQAYLTAFLVMSNTWKMAPNRGLPYNMYKNQKAFGTMGGPEISAALGLAAREAINVVWWHKWANHLRARPEATGGLVHLWKTGAANPPGAVAAFGAAGGEFDKVLAASLKESVKRNSPPGGSEIFLLSQAFPEGSPTHPAYPTGHGAVAGACITVLKFFFDCDRRFVDVAQPMVPTDGGLALEPYIHDDMFAMTLNGELHKLAHNISFGHGIHAGIHWRSDTDESLLLGEKVALDCLQALVNSYAETVSVSITLMNGQPKTFTN